MTADPLISTGELRRLPAWPTVTVLDVRYRLGGPPGREEYAAGHVPGAAYVDLDDATSPAAPGERGRHPLPDAGGVRARDARAPVCGGGRPVVVYDDWYGPGRGPGLVAAALPRPRRRAGARRRLVGLASRRRCGETGAASRVAAPGDFTAAARWDAGRRGGRGAAGAGAGRRAGGGALPRARSSRSTRSPATSPARSTCRPTANLDDDGRFRPAERLREVYAAVGRDRGRRRRGVLRQRRHRRPRRARDGGRRSPGRALPGQLERVGGRSQPPGRAHQCTPLKIRASMICSDSRLPVASPRAAAESGNTW